jgi:hypothetical protein
MKPLASLVIFAVIAFWSRPLHASELAHGHHLWSVQAPDGVRSYIAATDFTQSEKVAALLLRQLEHVPEVSRVVALGGRKAYSMPPDPRWKARARDVLSSDLLLAIDEALKPFVERISRHRARVGGPRISAEDLPLEFIRMILVSSSETLPHGKNQVLLTERIINQFAASRGGKVTFLYAPPPEAAVVERIVKAQSKSDPVEIMRKLVHDRRMNASIGDRQMQFFLQGDWKGNASLGDFGAASLLGIEESLIDEVRSTGMIVALDAVADMVTPVLSEGPTLLLLAPATSVLGEDHDLISELQRRGFVIRPISLADTRP